MATYYDRYKLFRENNTVKPIPSVVLTKKNNYKSFLYKKGESRLDKISQLYYNNPYHGWLILLANPEFGGLEFKIPDRTILTIPFPFKDALLEYENLIKTHIELYGK